ncbi:MAG: sulfotransferase family 2 domain-containing protein [Rhodospirillales bacterium]
MKLFFNHIPKAGGDSVHQVLGRAFGRFYANLNTNGFGQIGRATPLEALMRYTRSPNLLALGAHAQSPDEFVRHELLETCLGVSIVRDPVARLGSYYAFVKGAAHLPYHALANEVGIDAFFETMLKDESHGFTLPSQRSQLMYEITARLSGEVGEAESIGAIRRFFDRHYLLVGVTERMDLFYDRLQTMLRTILHRPGLVVEQVHANRTGGGAAAMLSPESMRTFRDRVSTDIDLHAHLSDEGVYYNEPLVAELAKLFR